MTADERFDRIEQLLQGFAQRFDQIDQRFDRMDQRFDRVDQSIENLSVRVGKVEESIAKLKEFTLEFRQETVSHITAIEARIEIPLATAASLELRLQPLSKAIMDFSSVTTQIMNGQWKQTDHTFNLEMRVSKLEEIVAKLKPAA
jgi:chromosome segregation ATPase